jgi:type II secretory pathway predicted ATPase ExeA
VHVSDSDAKRWLADDPKFLASLGDLDRGLADEEDDRPEPIAPIGPPPTARAFAPPPSPPAPPAPRPAAARPGRAARALDPARLLNTSALASPLAAADPDPDRRLHPAAVVPPPRPVAAAAPARFAPPDIFDAAEAVAPPPAPPLAFARPPAGAPTAAAHVRRPLLDLFPPSALQPDTSPLPVPGTAVGPQLPPRRPRPAPKPEPDAPSQLDALTYETFYGLREKPFSLSTDLRFLYPSVQHERAIRELLAAIRKRSGPLVLTAPVGLGKTTLCRSLVQEIDRRTVTSLVLDPPLSLDDLLQTMLVDFGVISRADLAGGSAITREVLTGTLRSFLESLVPLQASAVVILDEAQNLPVALLADLTALLSTASPETGILQMVLVGQPALTTLLRDRALRLLDASVARRTDLGPLTADEVSGYVMHRLSIAGANTRVEFDAEAIALLFAVSAGVPRVVNLLCDHAMTRGQQSSAAVIDAALIAAAAADLDLEPPEGRGQVLLASAAFAAVFALLVLAGAAGAAWMSRDALSRTIQQWENVPLPPGGPVRRLMVPIAPIPPPAEIPDSLRRDPATPGPESEI